MIENSIDTLETVGKMAIVSGTGIAMSFTDVEAILRIASIIVTMSLSIIVFVRSEKRKRNEKKTDKHT